MRTSFHNRHTSLRDASWPQFLAQMRSVSLTLVGFEGEELDRMYDAVELCARSKDIQTVEVFIRTIEDVSEDPDGVAPGLCMIRTPEPDTQDYRLTLLTLTELSRSDSVAVVSVLHPRSSDGEVLKMIGKVCPIYLNISSPTKDFASMFGAYLFPATASLEGAGLHRRRTRPGPRQPASLDPNSTLLEPAMASEKVDTVSTVP